MHSTLGAIHGYFQVTERQIGVWISVSWMGLNILGSVEMHNGTEIKCLHRTHVRPKFGGCRRAFATCIHPLDIPSQRFCGPWVPSSHKRQILSGGLVRSHWHPTLTHDRRSMVYDQTCPISFEGSPSVMSSFSNPSPPILTLFSYIDESSRGRYVRDACNAASLHQSP